MEPRWSSALGVEWRVSESARPLEGTGLHAVTVNVAAVESGPQAELVSLTGYLALRGTP
jgi:hypothetical protein